MLNWLHTLSHRWSSGFIVGSIGTYQVEKDGKTYNVTGLACRECGRIQIYQGQIVEGTPNDPDRTRKDPKGQSVWIDDLDWNLRTPTI